MDNNVFIFDTNTLISSALLKRSTASFALDKAIDSGVLAISSETFDELKEVLARKKFDKYFIDDKERINVLHKIELNSKLFVSSISITDCRDPKDNKFLELAVASNASCLISGDQDLLVLNPFRDIPILNATDFIEKFDV